jgi:DNA polymerase III subunit delta
MLDFVSAFEFLSRDKSPDVPPICVLYGDEPWLKQECLAKLRSAVLDAEDAVLSFTSFNGEDVELREVFDELATVSMFGGGRRMVLVEDADEFVSENRERLENYCDKPRQSSVLVLETSSWPATTRLFKKIAKAGLQINCNLPKARWGDGADEEPVARWLDARAASHHGARLDPAAAELLMEIVGPQLGRLDQELAKLALIAGASSLPPRPSSPPLITRDLVEQAVGGWRAKTAWAMIESALEGDAAAAIVQLDRLLLAGEEPIALLAMMAGSLRRMAAATRLVEQAKAERRRLSISDALIETGAKPNKFILNKIENQLRQIGAKRAGQIYRWLLEADLALKGASSKDERARLVLEELIVQLSKQMAAKPATARA